MFEFDIDLGNVTAHYINAIDQVEIEASQREQSFNELARQGLTCILEKLYEQDHTTTVLGDRLIDLPKGQADLPRFKPLPKAKEPTRWEKFAQRKGIVKRKRDRLVWDEANEDWRPRYGKNRANDQDGQWLIEHKEGMHIGNDPFATIKVEKQKRIEINKKNQLRNLKLAKGQRLPGQIDLETAIGSGSSNLSKSSKRDPKKHLQVSYDIAANSTASMGLFDKRSTSLEKTSTPIVKQKTTKKQTPKFQWLAEEKQAGLNVLSRTLRLQGQGKSAKFNSDRAANLELSKQAPSKGGRGGRKRRR